MAFPMARRAADQVFVQAIDDELVLYDMERDKSHALNETAAFVFEHCDGKTSPQQLSALLAERHDLDPADATELMWLSLDRLEQANLLSAPVERPGTMTRRQVLKRAGIAAAVLPVVYSITAPAAAAMISPVPCLEPCDPGDPRGCVVPCQCDVHFSLGADHCCERSVPEEPCANQVADIICCSGWRDGITGNCCDPS